MRSFRTVDLRKSSSKSKKFWTFLYYVTPGLGFFGVAGIIRGLRKITGLSVGAFALPALHQYRDPDNNLPLLPSIFYKILGLFTPFGLPAERNNDTSFKTECGETIDFMNESLLGLLQKAIKEYQGKDHVELEDADYKVTCNKWTKKDTSYLHDRYKQLKFRVELKITYNKIKNTDSFSGEVRPHYCYLWITQKDIDNLLRLEPKNLKEQLKKIKEELKPKPSVPNLRNIQCEPTQYKLTNKVSISALTFQSKTPLEEKETLHVFSFLGNMMLNKETGSESQADIQWAETHDINLVHHVLNYRGVDDSTGYAYFADEIIDDYYKIIRHQIKTIATEKNITPQHAASYVALKGHSLGGGLATIVAAKLHKKGYPVFLDNHYSFDYPHKAISWLADLPKPIRGILGLISRFAGWYMNVPKAYQSIPPRYKDHLVIKAKAFKTDPGENGANEDGVIAYKGSLHYALKRLRTQEKQIIAKFITALKQLQDISDQTPALKILSLDELFQNRKKLESNDMKKAITYIMGNRKKLENRYELHLGDTLNINEASIKDINALIKKLETLKDRRFKANKFTGMHGFMGKMLTSRGEEKLNGSEWYTQSLARRFRFVQKRPPEEKLRPSRSCPRFGFGTPRT